VESFKEEIVDLTMVNGMVSKALFYGPFLEMSLGQIRGTIDGNNSKNANVLL
jgi:hypothetical protein